jgi:4'-phosphopantetheinyl transferase
VSDQAVVVLTLHRLQEPLPEDWAVLDDDERERAGRFVFDRDRAPWVASHAWMRRQLGDVIGVDPHALVIDREGGKPHVAGGPAFSLSHTRTTSALAVCTEPGRAVGADVEEVPETVDRGAAALILGPRELAACDEGGPDAFARAWTRKEAWVKASGAGLDDGCRTVDLLGPTTPEGWAISTVAGLTDHEGHRLVASVAATAPRMVLTVRLSGIRCAG